MTVISIVKQDNLEVAYDALRDSAKFKDTKNPYETYGNTTKVKEKHTILSEATLDSLAFKCWNRIDKALDLGYETLLSRHVKSFSCKMNRVSLQGGPGHDPPSASSSTLVAAKGLVWAESAALLIL